MDSGCRRLDREDVACFALKRPDEGRLALAVERSHTTYVASEMSFFDEVGQYRLLDRGRVATRGRARGQKCVNEIRRGHNVAEPQRRKQNLAESPDVDDSPLVVQTLQRCERPPLVPVLAVV